MSLSPPRKESPSTDLSVSSFGSGSSSTGCGECQSPTSSLSSEENKDEESPQSSSTIKEKNVLTCTTQSRETKLSASSSSSSSVHTLGFYCPQYAPNLPRCFNSSVTSQALSHKTTSNFSSSPLNENVKHVQETIHTFNILYESSCMYHEQDNRCFPKTGFYPLDQNEDGFQRNMDVTLDNLALQTIAKFAIINSAYLNAPYYFLELKVRNMGMADEILETQAKDLAKKKELEWEEVLQHRDSIAKCNKQYGNNFMLIRWSEVEKIPLFADWVSFIKYLCDNARGLPSDNETARQIVQSHFPRLFLRPQDVPLDIKSFSQHFQNAVNGNVNNIQKTTAISAIVRSTLSEKVIREQIRSFLFNEIAGLFLVINLHRFNLQFYSGLPSIAESLFFGKFMVDKSLAVPVVIGNDELLTRCQKEIASGLLPKEGTKATTSTVPNSHAEKEESCKFRVRSASLHYNSRCVLFPSPGVFELIHEEKIEGKGVVKSTTYRYTGPVQVCKQLFVSMASKQQSTNSHSAIGTEQELQNHASISRKVQ